MRQRFLFFPRLFVCVTLMRLLMLFSLRIYRECVCIMVQLNSIAMLQLTSIGIPRQKKMFSSQNELTITTNGTAVWCIANTISHLDPFCDCDRSKSCKLTLMRFSEVTQDTIFIFLSFISNSHMFNLNFVNYMSVWSSLPLAASNLI